MLIGLVSLLCFESSAALFIFMITAGVSQGASSVIVSAVWSDLYSSQQLGTVRSWVVSLQILSTGLSPFLFGYLLDYGVKVNHLIVFCIAYVLFSACLLMIVSLWGTKKAAYV